MRLHHRDGRSVDPGLAERWNRITDTPEFSWPEVDFGEMHGYGAPLGLRSPRSPFLDHEEKRQNYFRIADNSPRKRIKDTTGYIKRVTIPVAASADAQTKSKLIHALRRSAR